MLTRHPVRYLSLAFLVFIHAACHKTRNAPDPQVPVAPKVSDAPSKASGTHEASDLPKVATPPKGSDTTLEQMLAEEKISRFNEQEQEKVRQILKEQENGMLSREAAVQAIDEIFKKKEEREKREAEEKAKREAEEKEKLANERLKDLHRYCKKYGDIDNQWGAAPCNFTVFYNELYNVNKEKAIKIILELPRKPNFKDLDKATTKLLEALKKNVRDAHKYEDKRLSTWDLLTSQSDTPFLRNKDARKWRNPSHKNDINAKLKKIKKQQKRMDKLFTQCKDKEFKKRVATDVLKELEEGKVAAEKEEDQKLVNSYATLLTPNGFERYVDNQIKKLNKAAYEATKAASKGDRLGKEEKELADKWLYYSNEAYHEVQKEFDERHYKKLLRECDQIEKDSWAVAKATMVKGEEKEIILKGYLIRLKEISKELLDLEEALKAYLNFYSPLERVTKALNPFK